jgi:hypothetical protein
VEFLVPHETRVDGFYEHCGLTPEIFSVCRVPRILHRRKKTLFGSHALMQVFADFGQSLWHVFSPSGPPDVAPGHLSGLSASVLRELAANLQEAVAHQESDEDALRRVLDQGLGRFRQVSERNLELPRHGSWEIASIVRGERPPARPNLQFLGMLLSSNPNYTGWRVWLDSRNFGDQTARPYLANEVWEAFIARFWSGSSDHLDFWRLSSAGEFYLYRAFQDDVPVRDRGPAPMTEFDFGLPVIRVAEAIGVALAYARALGTSGPEAAVLLGFRWTGLHGRELSSWAQPLRHLSPGRHAYRDEVFSSVAVPLETPQSAVHQFVHAATESLFEAFDAFQLSRGGCRGPDEPSFPEASLSVAHTFGVVRNRMTYAVAIVVDPQFGDRLAKLLDCKPVRIADTEMNWKAATRARASRSQPGQDASHTAIGALTTFTINPAARPDS